jgi:recombination protein RecA
MEKKDIKQAINEVKKFGVDIRKVSDNHVDDKIKVLPTGSLTLDMAIGTGGYPCGMLVEIFGPESGGKSTLSLLAVKQCQKAEGNVALLDIENSFNIKWAKSLGINIDNLYIAQPDYAEQTLDTVIKLIDGGFDLIIVDSTAALVPKSEMEGNLEDPTMAPLARVMSKGLRKIVNRIKKSDAVVIFINQIREKVGTMWGSPEDTPGGRALKFYSAVRIRVAKVSRSERLNDNKEPMGHSVKFKVVKNKVGPPLREGEFYLSYTKGIKRSEEVFNLGTKLGIIEFSGGRTYIYKNFKWNGQEQCKTALKENKELRQEITTLIQQKI